MMRVIFRFLFFIITTSAFSQIDESQKGSWYMYFYNHQFKTSQFGIQGDFQYRDWQVLGDREQLLVRSGITYTPKETSILFTVGFANITSGVFGDSNETLNENRIYQEALLPQQIGEYVFVTHRFRFEQRFVEHQDFRTRYRYNIFINVPFNSKNLSVSKTIYSAFYNELFINGERNIGQNASVEFFDRNRTYFGLGYVLNPKVRFQIGYLQQTTNAWSKGQMQFSMHHNF